jgi:branched-chain amino acid transport system permease protein
MRTTDELGPSGRGGTFAAAAAAFGRRHAAYIVFAVVIHTVPIYLSNTYYLSVLGFVATRFMMALGLSMLLGQAGQVSLGQAAFVGIGAYGGAVLTTRVGLDPWLAMFLGALLAVVIAGLVGIPTLRLRGHYLAMATLGVNEIVYILLVQLKVITNGTDGLAGVPALSLFGWDLGQPRAYHVVVWAVALIMLALSLNLARSRVGRSLRALRRSEAAAQSLGINTSYRKVQVFMLAAAFASIAGSFDAFNVRFVSPESYTITFSIILITGVIIGGLGTLWGALWGTVVIVVLPELLKRVNQDLTNLVFGVLLIVIMIFWQGRSESVGRALLARVRRTARPPVGGDLRLPAGAGQPDLPGSASQDLASRESAGEPGRAGTETAGLNAAGDGEA